MIVSGWQREAVNRLLVTIVCNGQLVPEDQPDFAKECLRETSVLAPSDDRAKI